MTSKDIWAALAVPFTDEVKTKPGPGTMTFSYVDARAVEQRLDDVLSPESWDFQVQPLPGNVAHGRLIIYAGERAITREDFGYAENDQEPLKAAASDALKRCAVQFGIGRHLYDDNRASRSQSNGASPRPAPPPTPPQRGSSAPTGETEWVCPDHGSNRVREGKRGGWYCATKMDDGSWCQRKPGDAVQPRPLPAEEPSEPPYVAADFDQLPF